MRIAALLAVLAALTFTGSPSLAVQPDEVLDDPALESRARDLSKELRCLVCQNQSIDDSDADLARDLRLIVRERLVEGDSDREVLDFVVARYGDYVLLRPPVNLATAGLWFGPFVILLIAGTAVFFWLRRRPAGGADVASAGGGSAGGGLSKAEQDRIAALLAEDDPNGSNRKG